MHPSTSANAPSDYRRTWNAIVGWLFVLGTTVINVPWQLHPFIFSKPEELRVDLTGMIVLNHSFMHGAKFGTQIILPYGPYIFLMWPIYWPGLYWYIIFGRLLIVAAMTLGSWHLLRSVGLWNPLTAALVFIGLGFLNLANPDSLFVLAAPLLLYCYAVDGSNRASFATLLLAVAAALISFARFSSFLLTSFIVVVTIIVDIKLRHRIPFLAMMFTPPRLEDEGTTAADSDESRPRNSQENRPTIPKNLQIRILARNRSAYRLSHF